MDLANMTWLTKAEFMERYAPSETTYWRRMKKLRAHEEFRKAYVSPTEGEIWIVEEIYKQFLIWMSDNKHAID